MTCITVCLEDLKILITKITSTPLSHARWLNTLSYLENCGARKIAACEHPTKVKCEMLKHAAEEFRHAYHLKVQTQKVTSDHLEDYSSKSLLGGAETRLYLAKLDLLICRYLKFHLNLSKQQVKEMAYLLVTYAIEKRASILYPLYQEVLASQKSNVTMRAIIADEDHHLQEMENELAKYPDSNLLTSKASSFETILFQHWISKIKVEYISNKLYDPTP